MDSPDVLPSYFIRRSIKRQPEDSPPPPPPKKLRCFAGPSQSRDNRWDRVVIVEGQKFHVLAAQLSTQADFFDSMFYGEYAEKNQQEITLTDPYITAEDFQTFLEAINGELSIRDSNINKLMHWSDVWGAHTVMRQCKNYMLKESKKSTLEKFEIAKQYNMEELLKQTISNIKDMNELLTLLPSNLENLEKNVMGMLFKKSLAL